jgi:mannan endo-1,4-beta-mannosidase
MKKLILLTAAIVFTAACVTQQAGKQGPADKSATVETVNMLAGLKAAAEKGIMFGHQDDLAYGIGWVYPDGESDVFKVASDYPAVYGMDLGHIELDSPVNLDSVPFEDMRTFVREIWARGGVITFSWHADNPLTDSSAWDISSDMTVSSVLPGGENHDKYKSWLDKVAAFFSSLTDDNGVAIPVIFRPYHEHTGSWFWWGQNLCTADEFKSLWRFTFTYLCEEKNLHSLLFAYSSSSNIRDSVQYLERYPGDDYTDLLGFDHYQMGRDGKESFIKEVDRVLGIVTGVAAGHEKLPALTEAGFEGIPDSTWWTGTLWPAIKNHKISYVLVWRNAHNIPGHFFAPYPGQASADNFVEFCNMPTTLFQKELTDLDIYK